jgi:rhodanese-related sulfurtransferase
MDWEVTCEDVRNLLQSGRDLLLLDCRERDEHQLVHIDQATLIPMSELATRLDEIERFREREVVVHCHHGGRSLKVTQWLRQQGFTRVRSMAGGIDAWSLRINPRLARY